MREIVAVATWALYIAIATTSLVLAWENAGSTRAKLWRSLGPLCVLGAVALLAWP